MRECTWRSVLLMLQFTEFESRNDIPFDTGSFAILVELF